MTASSRRMKMGSGLLRTDRDDSRDCHLSRRNPLLTPGIKFLQPYTEASRNPYGVDPPFDTRHNLVRVAAPSAKTEFGTFSAEVAVYAE
jgi:hypothetical protein